MNKEIHRIAVLMLGYNDKANLKDAIDSVLRQKYEDFELIYIDNGSTDKSIFFVKNYYPVVRTVANDKNLGYAGAYKIAIPGFFREGFDACVLLNADVIVANDWLSELVKTAFAAEKIALAQPKIFLWDKNGGSLVNSFGNKINFLGFGYCGHYKKRDGAAYDHDQEITYASGASLLIKKEAHEAIGSLDGDFFSYLEDQDLGWRARMSGYKIVLSAKSRMWHKYKFDRTERNHNKFYLLERNRLYFLYKNYELKTLFLILPTFLFMEIGIIIHSIFTGYFGDKLRGYADFINNFESLRKKRTINQRKRAKSDAELFSELSPVIEFEEINARFLVPANAFLRFNYFILKKLI